MNIEVAKQRVNEVIQVDTNTNSESDFLVTHVPFRQIMIKNGGGKINEFKKISEEEIFNQYIKNPGNRHQFIIVQGASGSGKSHLIRWFASKFNTFQHDNETVIYIRRSDNSLKGTIRQLLDLEEVKNLPNREIYKRLSDAGSSISSSELKNTIYYHLIAKIKSNTNRDILSTIENSKLIALLSNQDFMEKFLNRPGFDKPIDRIYRKVAPPDGMKGINDKPARFEASDFDLDQDFILKMRANGADSKAIRLAEKLCDFVPTNLNTGKMQEKIASYLNQFVDSVIQEIAGLQPEDFENVFSEIRRELFRQGKNLTLLIEDITSFTGVNQALLNVLTDTHTGTAEVKGKEMCRLSSVVGTTTEYYEEFRDNFVNRISQEIYIKDDALTGESSLNSLIEFVAKYLNAMSLSHKDVKEWADRGAYMEEFPVALSNEPAFWEKYDLDDTHSLSLYPLNRNSIINLTNSLGEGRKTPRYILTDVVRRAVQDVLINREKFPSFSINAALLNNMGIRERSYMSNQVKDAADQKRLLELMCVWGDSTIKDQTDDAGNRYLAGIRYEVYDTFGLHDITGQDSGKIHEEISNKIIDKDNRVSTKNSIQSDQKENKDLQKLTNMLVSWVHGGQFLDSRNDIRGTLNTFIFNGIDWQTSGVSFENVALFKKYGFVTVENLNRPNATGLYVIPANNESSLLISASEKWRLLGKMSWDYEDSLEDMYYLTKWIHDITPVMIELVNNYVNKHKNRMEEAALSYAAYTSLFNGQQVRTSDLTNLLSDIRSNKPENAIQGEHSDDWHQLQNSLNHDPGTSQIIKLAGGYFNIKQDSGASNKIFMNREAYDPLAKTLIRNGFIVENIEEMFDEKNDVIAERWKVTKKYKYLFDRLHKITEAEDKFSQSIASGICEAFGLESIDQLDQDIVNEFFNGIKDYKESVKNADLLTCISNIDKQNVDRLSKSKDKICSAAKQLESGLTADSDFKKMSSYSTNPCGILLPFKNLIDEVNKSILEFKHQSCFDCDHHVDEKQLTPLEQNKEKILSRTDEIEKKIETIGGIL